MDRPSDKKTGLGSSLLIRRTDEPPQEREHPAVSEASGVSEPAKTENPETLYVETLEIPKRPDVQTSRRSKRQVVRDRCTLYLDQDVNRQLDLTARLEGKDRSDVVSELLRQHLPEYEVIPKR